MIEHFFPIFILFENSFFDGIWLTSELSFKAIDLIDFVISPSQFSLYSMILQLLRALGEFADKYDFIFILARSGELMHELSQLMPIGLVIFRVLEYAWTISCLFLLSF